MAAGKSTTKERDPERDESKGFAAPDAAHAISEHDFSDRLFTIGWLEDQLKFRARRLRVT